jgi:2-dehydro-3-deoxyphosphogluconate aldolase/(4S)-4-hydroxy-2-oxoglutarate aldolase
MGLSPVIAVVGLADASKAAPLARALVAGGVRAIEITLRTPAALEAVRQAAGVEGAVVGAGTVLNPADFHAAQAAGARFIVSPGLTPELLDCARESGLPYLPGVATASELMQGLTRGLARFKLFPAEAIGGRTLLRSFAGPFPHVRFCPTGGITPELVPEYMKLSNVACVGGSWLAPEAMLAAGDWSGLERLARDAVSRGSRPI